MKKLLIILISLAMLTMVSCGFEPTDPAAFVKSSESEQLSEKVPETTDFSKEKAQIESTTKKAQESSAKNIVDEVDKTVVSTENFTEGKANMKTTPINTTSKSTDDDTTTEESPDTNEAIKVETEQNPETEDINSYLVLGSDALREIVLQRYKLADNSSISSICNSFSQEELISQIHFMCPFNTATTFYQLDKFYPIEYLHIPDSEKGVGYCIYKLNEGGKLFVFFDDNPDGLYFVTNIFVVKDLLTQDDFSELQIGMTLEDVEKIDLGTKVLNSINDDYLCFCQTTHIVKDGFIQIKYTKKEDTHNSVDDHSNLIISSIEFIQNGGFIEFPNELDYDYVKGGMKYFIEAEADTDSSGGIRTIAVDFSDDNAVEITLTEGEQVQLVIPDEPDMPEINYVAFYASNQIAAVSHDLRLTGICAGEEYVTVYIGRKGMRYEEWQNLRLHILKNDSISAENRDELERLNQLDGFYRRKMELVGTLDEDAPRLDMEKVQEIIDTSEDYTEMLMRFNQYHGYADIYPAGGGHTSYSYWFDPKGNESICYILEEESIFYIKTADDGTVIGVQGLYPEKTEFLPNGKDKNYEYVQYNQIKPDGYGTLNLKFIDSSTGEAFMETNGKFQLLSDDKVIKSWDASAESEITIGDLSRECNYELRYIDDYHGGVLFNQQYRYEIDHDKGTSCFSFGYDSEVSCKVYMKKRHRGDPYLLGDVNGDNSFNVADVVTLQKWLLGKPDTVLMNWEAADLCMDGKLDVFDLCLMKRELIEKMNEDSQNVDTSFELQSVVDIRINSDSHKKWTGFIVRSENDLKDIIKENECVSADEFSIEGIDSSIFKDKSLIIVYSICTAGNSYSVIDNISVKDTGIDVSTISKKPMIATPDMLYRRYIYLVDKNAVTNVDGFTFNDASSYYQDDEEKDVAKWYKEWCQS